MTVVDVTDPPIKHPLFEEAEIRGCRTIDAGQVYKHQIRSQFNVMTGKELPDSVLEHIR